MCESSSRWTSIPETGKAREKKPTFSLQPLLILFTGGTLAITGTYLLVTFAPHNSVHITAHLVQYYMLCWQFLLYLVSPLLSAARGRFPGCVQVTAAVLLRPLDLSPSPKDQSRQLVTLSRFIPNR